MLKGGKRGPAVVPGNADESLLYKAVKRDGDLQMPPGKTPLTAAEVSDSARLDQRPEQSANRRRRLPPDRRGGRLRNPSVLRDPAVKNAAGYEIRSTRLFSRNSSRRACSLAPEADRRTLARRAYFDLHGLPPTPEQVDEFVNDQIARRLGETHRPSACLAAIRRAMGPVLARPGALRRHVGVRDGPLLHDGVAVSRLGDQVASTRTSRTTPSCRSRSPRTKSGPRTWTSKARRKLPKEKEENVNRRIGTSLFTLGSFPIEYTYYGDQFRAEWQADAVDTVGAAFLGLTVGCARCHDHKFDPISQRDYYSMTALFAGSVEREIPLGQPVRCADRVAQLPAAGSGRSLKRMARGAGRGRRARADATANGDAPKAKPRVRRGSTMDPQRAALLQKLGEAYLRAPERYADGERAGA